MRRNASIIDIIYLLKKQHKDSDKVILNMLSTLLQKYTTQYQDIQNQMNDLRDVLELEISPLD
jgi:hypothetical protein